MNYDELGLDKGTLAMRYNTYDDLRNVMPQDLPWAIREAILGNVVVGNFTDDFALRLSWAIGQKLRGLK